MPPRPYLPVGTLRFTITYPEPEDRYPDDVIREALQLFGLGAFVALLDDQAQWHVRLSVAEQQRLSFVRVLVKAPDWLFLDEATSALDEAMEAHAYATIRDRFPGTTLLSIAHRPSVATLHGRRWLLVPGDDDVGLVIVD